MSLRPFVRVIWTSTSSSADLRERELVLPGGMAHLVFRLDEPLWTYNCVESAVPRLVGNHVLGGPRAEPYVRCMLRPASSVGAELSPGALSLALGDRADLLAHRHSLLSEVWGQAAESLGEELCEIADPEHRLARLEMFLEERFAKARELHPAVRQALQEFQSGTSVHAVALSTGYSERRLSTLFREAVGLSPKLYVRLRRFQVALNQLHAGPTTSMAQIAAMGGYADQAHFSREFHAFAGISAQHYRRLAPSQARHVPLPYVPPRV